MFVGLTLHDSIMENISTSKAKPGDMAAAPLQNDEFSEANGQHPIGLFASYASLANFGQQIPMTVEWNKELWQIQKVDIEIDRFRCNMR